MTVDLDATSPTISPDNTFLITPDYTARLLIRKVKDYFKDPEVQKEYKAWKRARRKQRKALES